jgi:hypothetical protein
MLYFPELASLGEKYYNHKSSVVYEVVREYGEYMTIRNTRDGDEYNHMPTSFFYEYKQFYNFLPNVMENE